MVQSGQEPRVRETTLWALLMALLATSRTLLLRDVDWLCCLTRRVGPRLQGTQRAAQGGLGCAKRLCWCSLLSLRLRENPADLALRFATSPPLGRGRWSCANMAGAGWDGTLNTV